MLIINPAMCTVHYIFYMFDLNFKSFSEDLGPGRGRIGDILTLSLGQPNTLYVIHVLGTRVYFILYAFSHSSFGYTVYTYIRVLNYAVRTVKENKH